MKARVTNGLITNIVPDNDITGNKDIILIDWNNEEITKDQDLYTEDMQCKYKYENGKIIVNELDKEKYNKFIIRKRLARYQTEVDPLTLEAIRLGVSTTEGKKLKDEANAIVEKIKQDLPKVV